MDADEIQPLSHETLARLLAANAESEATADGLGKRRQPRWPFPGAIELWLAAEDGAERHVLGVVHNLSQGGVGVRLDEPLDLGTTISLALHQPALSLHGKGQVRHCSPRGEGYLVGVEFLFEGA